MTFEQTVATFVAMTPDQRGACQARMKAAFDKVAPIPNWKMPINCVVMLPTGTTPAEAFAEAATISDAIVWFTGGHPTKMRFVPSVGTLPAFLAIDAPGYYATVGA